MDCSVVGLLTVGFEGGRNGEDSDIVLIPCVVVSIVVVVNVEDPGLSWRLI